MKRSMNLCQTHQVKFLVLGGVLAPVPWQCLKTPK